MICKVGGVRTVLLSGFFLIQLVLGGCGLQLTEQDRRKEKARAEATFALHRRVLVPIKIGDVSLPPPFNIRQTIDLIGWSGDRTQTSWKQLVAAVRQLAPASDTP